MKYLKYFEKKVNFNYLFPVDEDNNFMFDSFEYLKDLNADPKIFDVPEILSLSFNYKKFAIKFNYTEENNIPDFIINRSLELTDNSFAKLNLIRNEQKEKEALQYITNKKFNL